MANPGGVGRNDPVILVSNRGPVQYDVHEGERVADRGGGGLVTALAGLAGRLDDAVWVCGALTDEDAVVAREHGGNSFEWTALTMEAGERKQRREACGAVILENDIGKWLRQQLVDVRRMRDNG